MRGPPIVLGWDAPRALVCDAPSCVLARSRPLVLLSQPSLPPGYMRGTLKPRQLSIYRAAGVLLYRVKGEEVEVLLGRNAAGMPGSSRHDTWNLIGGKRKSGESHPTVTAAREVNEETLGMVSAKTVREALAAERAVLWLPRAMYACFVARLAAEDHRLLRLGLSLIHI